jgi:hypothetical protein
LSILQHKDYDRQIDLPSGRRTRRTVTLLGVCIVAALGMVAAGTAPSAWACGLSNHCYAMGQASGPANYGQQATISINCLYAPNDGAFVTNEMWDGNGTYWVEAGAISGHGYNSTTYFSRELFWEDSRPGSMNVHFHPVQAANPASYYVAMYYVGSNTWDLDVNGWSEQSTGQPLFSGRVYTQGGTEYTYNSGSGFRDVGQVQNIQWASSDGIFHAEGGSMQPVAGGQYANSGAFIVPNYNSSTSTASWTGPC